MFRVSQADTGMLCIELLEDLGSRPWLWSSKCFILGIIVRHDAMSVIFRQRPVLTVSRHTVGSYLGPYLLNLDSAMRVLQTFMTVHS